MATRQELEQLKKALGITATVPLTDDLAESANVIKAVGMERMSPAGTLERLPLEMSAPDIRPGVAELTPQNLGLRSPQPKKGFFGKLSSVVSQLGETAASPAGAKFLGQMAQAYSGQFQNSVGAQLGRFGVAAAEERSEASLLARAMGADSPEAARETALTATGRDLGALTPDARRRVAEDLALQRKEGREERGLGLEEKLGESLITTREAQVLDAEERRQLESDKIKLDIRKLDFAADQDEWDRGFKEQQNEWQSEAALAGASANRALADMRRAQTEALEAGRTLSGGKPGKGSGNWYSAISSLSSTHSRELDSYNQKFAILDNHFKMIARLKPLEERGKLSEVQQRELQVSRDYVRIHEPALRRQQEVIFQTQEALNNLLSNQGVEGDFPEMELAGGGEEGEMTGPVLQSGGESDLSVVASELVSAIRSRDPQKTVDAATRLYSAGKITIEQFHNAIRQVQ